MGSRPRTIDPTKPGYHEPVIETPHAYVAAWTDGSSTGTVGDGGWAWVVVDGAQAGLHDSGGASGTTNQRMEIQAAHEAVKAIPGLLVVVSDSQYVVNCFRDRWYLGWMERRWRKILNADLWRPFILDVLERRGEVRFEWVKGHIGLEGNERADELAGAARLAHGASATPSEPVPAPPPEMPAPAPPVVAEAKPRPPRPGAVPVAGSPAALRERYAADICGCGHERARHYLSSGSTATCRTCRCTNYHWRDA